MAAPQLLAFPYRAQSHGSVVWSESPLSQPALNSVFDRTLGLVSESPLIDARGETRHIFLTDGGWRWKWLALQMRNGFALSRAFTETIVVNRADLSGDRIAPGRPYVVGNAIVRGRRSLSGTLAHEFCHGMERRRFGPAVDLVKPTWLREGYCDHVSKESSLSNADVARLRSSGQTHPALVYYEGRRKVAAILARNGGAVDAMFAAN